jgi:alkyl hydroperoxide reductase subunit F
VETESGGRYEAKMVVYAAGKKPKKLNVPGEAEFTGRGVSYCAICDGPIFSGQKVAVVGSGNSGLEATLDMIKIAEQVTLVSMTPLTGDPILAQRLSGAGNLSILTEHVITEIRGKEFVQEVRIKDLKSGELKKQDVAAVFVEIGMEPNSEAVKELVKLNEWGEVPVNCRDETATPGLFAAGDVTDVPEKQIIVAAGEGAKAALQAHRYLQRLQ